MMVHCHFSLMFEKPTMLSLSLKWSSEIRVNWFDAQNSFSSPFVRYLTLYVPSFPFVFSASLGIYLVICRWRAIVPLLNGHIEIYEFHYVKTLQITLQIRSILPVNFQPIGSISNNLLGSIVAFCLLWNHNDTSTWIAASMNWYNLSMGISASMKLLWIINRKFGFYETTITHRFESFVKLIWSIDGKFRLWTICDPSMD